MFERTRDYNTKEAQNLVESIRQKGFIHQFLELFYCFHDLAKTGEKDSFKEVAEAVLEWTVSRNPQYPREQVRLETLARLEFVCIQVDRGTISIGFPILHPEKPGRTYQQLLDLYKNEIIQGFDSYSILPGDTLKWD